MSGMQQEPEKIVLTSGVIAGIERRIGRAISPQISPIILLYIIRLYITERMQNTPGRSKIIADLDHLALVGGQLAIYVQLPTEDHIRLGNNVIGYDPQPQHLITLTIPRSS
jgi:hypothetical protein